MKTDKKAVEILKESGLILTDFISSSHFDAAIKAMQAYHSAKLEEGIKVKALKKAGTDKFYHTPIDDTPTETAWYTDTLPDIYPMTETLEDLREYFEGIFPELPNDVEEVELIIIPKSE